MWESRKDKLPPSQFYVDIIQHLRNLYPNAPITRELVREMQDIWLAEWRNGQNAQDTAKATCSCDGKVITASPGAGKELGKRLARPPAKAKRGDFISPDDLREITPLAKARKQAEVWEKRFVKLKGIIANYVELRKTRWKPKDNERVAKWRSQLATFKAEHDKAIAQYEAALASRKGQPGVHRGNAIAKLEQASESDTPAVVQKQPKAKKPAKAEKSAKIRWSPPKLQPTGMKGRFKIALEAAPNEDFASSDKYLSTVKFKLRWYPASTLGVAQAMLRAFVDDNKLGGGNMTPQSGRITRAGKPFGRISYNGRIWEVDSNWQENGKELDNEGRVIADPNPRKSIDYVIESQEKKVSVAPRKKGPKGKAETAAIDQKADSAKAQVADNSQKHDCDDCSKKKAKKAEAPAEAPKKRGRPPKPKDAPTASKTDAAKSQSVSKLLSETEQEELANMFAAASLKDSPGKS